MSLLQKIRSSFLSTGIALLVAVASVLTVGCSNAWAAASMPTSIEQSTVQLAAMNRVESATKNLEGKAQEMIGNITDSPKDKVAGKAKQVESRMQTIVEDVKDQKKLKGKAKSAEKDIQRKVREMKR